MLAEASADLTRCASNPRICGGDAESRQGSLSSCPEKRRAVSVPRLRLDNLSDKIEEAQRRRRHEKLREQAKKLGIGGPCPGEGVEDQRAGLAEQLKLLTGLGSGAPPKVS